jgi:putative zinc finger protein
MSTCLKEEQFQALVDNELAETERESISTHIAGCEECREKLDAIQSSAMRLNSLMDSLVPEGMPEVSHGLLATPNRESVTAWGLVGVISATAVAALVLLAVIFLKRAPDRPNSPAVAQVASVTVPTAITPAVVPTVAHTPKKVIRPQHNSQPRTLQFHALDNGGPIEEGLIYRINLPISDSAAPIQSKPAKTVPAEVIVDETGQVRAIRFLQ